MATRKRRVTAPPTIPLSTAEKKRLTQCANEAKQLLCELFRIDRSGQKSKPIIRRLRELLPMLEALTVVAPAFREIIDAGPDGAGFGWHQPPMLQYWPAYRKQLHDEALRWLEALCQTSQLNGEPGRPPPYPKSRAYGVEERRRTPRTPWKDIYTECKGRFKDEVLPNLDAYRAAVRRALRKPPTT
jgi:hypothetical protein